MPRWLTAIFAGAETLLVLAIGVGIPLVTATLVWAAQYGFAADYIVIWRIAADTWLLGHGVDVTFTLAPETADALGLAGAGLPVDITIALLGFALLTFLLALRAGRRVAEAGHPVVGGLAAVAVFAGGTIAIVVTALHVDARPSIVQGILYPALFFAAGLAIGMATSSLRPQRESSDRFARAVGRIRDRIPVDVRVGIDGVVRGSIAAVAGLLAVAAVITALSIGIAFAQMIALYESLHAEILGGAVLTVAQLALLPNAVIWTASWLVGPGFAVGAGSSVSPFATALGPVPPIPLFGAIPAEAPPLAWVLLIAPLAAGLVAGMLTHRRISRVLRDWWAVLVGIGAGVLGGVIMGLLAAWSAGAGGPGRLVDLGPDGLQVGIWAAIAFCVAIVIGMLVDAQVEAFARRRLPLSR
ncbi:MAG TPA: DUF6350 family protein [Microbacteriaceae bacterium]|nr:DUF6350 family protein [Microbacteriaceae bacterium]